MSAPQRDNGLMIQITSEGMGQGDPGLRLELLGKWLTLVLENGKLPAAICFYTDGVRLVVEDSPVLPQLERLEEAGVRLIVCSTCLNRFGLAGRVRVGIVGGMGDIIAAQWTAARVVSL